jgi:putative Holliday junction resolvase
MAVVADDLPRQGCLMGLDVGDRRVGVALSDAMQVLATPATVITRLSRDEDSQRLARLANERSVAGLVVGHPLNADGSAGPQARRTARYGHRLANALALPVVLWDEYGSSQEAARRLAAAGRRAEGTPLDAEAAAIILQDYLDARRASASTT